MVDQVWFILAKRATMPYVSGMDINTDCERCKKPEGLCVCSLIQPLSTRTRVLILQHPQEPDQMLGTAHLAHLSLPQSVVKIGLSWRNLSAALGERQTPAGGAFFIWEVG